MDAAQILLFSVVIIVTISFLLVGIQVFIILKILRKTIEKVNKILDDAGVISENISKPLSDVSSIVSGFKTGISILNIFTKKNKKNPKEENNE